MKRDDIVALLRMIDCGVLEFGTRAGLRIMGRYRLEEWEEALKCTKENARPDMLRVFVPPE